MLVTRSMSSLIFLSTPSARRATAELFMSGYLEMDFYPRPPRGGRLGQLKQWGGQFIISIHALREEGDADALIRLKRAMRFLSTPSARRATLD